MPLRNVQIHSGIPELLIGFCSKKQYFPGRLGASGVELWTQHIENHLYQSALLLVIQPNTFASLMHLFLLRVITPDWKPIATRKDSLTRVLYCCRKKLHLLKIHLINAISSDVLNAKPTEVWFCLILLKYRCENIKKNIQGGHKNYFEILKSQLFKNHT